MTPLATDVTLFHDPAAWVDMAAWHARVAELRQDHRAVWAEGDDIRPYLAILRHADIFDIERHHDLWRNTAEAQLAPDSFLGQARSMGMPDPKTLIHLDGHDHHAHRQVTNDWFKPAATARWQERIDAIADEFIAKMRDLGGECDFAVDVAQPFTLRVIMEIYGVPVHDEPTMLELTQGIFGATDPEFTDQDVLVTALGSVMKFIQYFAEITDDRRACPRDDLATVIANGAVDGCPMDDEHRLWYYIIVATAGHDTTSFALAGGLQAMLENPGQFALLQENPGLVTNAAEECIRWTSPVRHMMRYAHDDTEIAGHAMPAGSRVLLCYPSANRDEAVFERSMEFDIARPDADKLISFGLGPHFCLGAHFARREIRTMLGKLAAQVESIELAGPPLNAEAHFVSGTKHLPVRYTFR